MISGGHPVPLPHSEQIKLHQVTQSHVPLSSEYLKRWRSYNLKAPLPELDPPHCASKFFLTSFQNIPCSNLHTLPLLLSPCIFEKNVELWTLYPSIRQLQAAIKAPPAFSSLGWTNPVLLVSPHMTCSSPLINLVASAGAVPVASWISRCNSCQILQAGRHWIKNTNLILGLVLVNSKGIILEAGHGK